MLIQKSSEILPSEITDQDVYQDRRRFLQTSAVLAAGAVLGAGEALAAQKLAAKKSAYNVNEPLTPYADVTSYNNFYEFGFDKDSPAKLARNFVTKPWTVSIEGLVNRPKTWDIEELLRLGLEERVYRMRCVEGWSMVIPWVGFPLNELLRRAEPQGSARYVEFETLHDPARMPGQRTNVLRWPYVEGLRLDEALHPLTLMAVGLYGEVLPNQNGAPIRLVVPWKYGFKSAKSIVRIRLVEKQPLTAWMRATPEEYGFYSNVNPDVDHPRWSQARERRIGDFFKRKTLPFNGYGEQVASMYAGMDLKKYF